MLELKNIKIWRGEAVLLGSLSAVVAKGEVLTVMGPSGAGKSTLLSAIGGSLEPPFRMSGEIMLNGEHVTNQPPARRGMARLFQDDLLFPHMTVGENLLFAIPALPFKARVKKAEEALHRAGLAGYGNRAPHTLSGGQRQRVALLRALLSNPRAILLDEPFSRFDEALKAQMRDYVFSQIKELGIPALLVTHDRGDAPAGSRILKIGENGSFEDV